MKKTKIAKAKPTFKQCRNWCFTDFELLNFELIYTQYKDIIRYIVFGNEICPDTKKPHIQGFIQFVNKKTMGGVKRIFQTKKIHLEQCYGTEAQNQKYCIKDGKYKQFGKYKIQGGRSDKEQVQKDLEENKPMLQIAKDNFDFFLRYHQAIYKYRQLILQEQTKRFRKLEVILIKGETGKGKTKSAFEIDPNLFKIEGSQLQWFDGYEGEKTLLIDEYNNDINITRLLNLTDGYRLRLPIKGGFTYANWNRVIITTNLSQLHSNAKKVHIDALNRRITKVINLFDKLPKCPMGNTIPTDTSLDNLEPETDDELFVI